MQGSKYSLINFMSGADRRFIIPVYQRNYDWKTEQCQQLFDDIVKIVRLKRKSHFLGCLVSVHNDFPCVILCKKASVRLRIPIWQT